jgi:hypothetical protein
MNGYETMHRLRIEARADMLESAAGLTVGRVREELAHAARTLDENDDASLRWLACLCERRIDDLHTTSAISPARIDTDEA